MILPDMVSTLGKHSEDLVAFHPAHECENFVAVPGRDVGMKCLPLPQYRRIESPLRFLFHHLKELMIGGANLDRRSEIALRLCSNLNNWQSPDFGQVRFLMLAF
jgi:hypothetical protein